MTRSMLPTSSPLKILQKQPDVTSSGSPSLFFDPVSSYFTDDQVQEGAGEVLSAEIDQVLEDDEKMRVRPQRAQRITSTQPSKVIHFRNVVSEITQADLLTLCSPFGRVTHVLLLKNNQALVQFANITSAIEFMSCFGAHMDGDDVMASGKAQIRNIPMYPNFSAHQELSKGLLTQNSFDGGMVPSQHAFPNVPSQGGLFAQQQSFNETAPFSRILLVTFYIVQYPITVDILHTVFVVYGPIEKIVLFNKGAGLQALIQFANQRDAVRARQELQSSCLYGNSCFMSIQFSNLPGLTVHANTERARDYTKLPNTTPVMPNGNSSVHQTMPIPISPQIQAIVSNGPSSPARSPSSSPHISSIQRSPTTTTAVASSFQQQQFLQQPPSSSVSSLFSQGPYGQWYPASSAHSSQHINAASEDDFVSSTPEPGTLAEDSSVDVPSYLQPQLQFSQVSQQQFNGSYQHQMMPGQYQSFSQDKAVLLVSNFNDKKLDCEKLFNLFSCYGYVVKVKIFRTKPDHALIQMASAAQAQTAIACLKGLELHGRKLSVNFSKHDQINSGGNEPAANDMLTRDYSKLNLNRFPRSISAQSSVGKSRNRYMCHPTSTLHISNLDVKMLNNTTVASQELLNIFGSFGEVEGHRLFDHGGKAMALVRYKNTQSAVEALCTLHNNCPFKNQALPIKISFSTNKV